MLQEPTGVESASDYANSINPAMNLLPRQFCRRQNSSILQFLTVLGYFSVVLNGSDYLTLTYLSNSSCCHTHVKELLLCRQEPDPTPLIICKKMKDLLPIPTLTRQAAVRGRLSRQIELLQALVKHRQTHFLRDTSHTGLINGSSYFRHMHLFLDDAHVPVSFSAICLL